MSPFLVGRVTGGLVHSLAPLRLTFRLAAAGWTAVACVWCAAVGSVGILGQGLAAIIALSVLGASGLAAVFALWAPGAARIRARPTKDADKTA
jgi:hypothetical protein